MINIALAVEQLVPAALYHDAATYTRLTATWFDARAIPTEAELDAAWAVIVAERDAFAAKQVRDAALEASAKVTAKNIPAWATFTESEAISYIQTNVTDLTSAKTVLIALARMVVHLRDAQWPDLGDN